MDELFDKIFDKWDAFARTHTRQFMPQRQKEVRALFERIQLELMDEAVFTSEETSHTLSVTITAESFLSSDQFPTLQELIHRANDFQCYIKDNCIVLDLWFTFVEWVPIDA